MKYRKAVTFSYDDGVESDRKLVEILNRYGMKCSFNLNSGLYHDPEHCWDNHGFEVHRIAEFEPDLYKGHEICIHGSEHLWPSRLSDQELEKEFLQDKETLERLAGQKIVGCAYAFGDYDNRTVAYLKSIGICFSRTTKATHTCDLQEDLLRFNPTAHHNDEELFEVIDRFIEDDSDQPQLLYIWGHSYEFDGLKNWDRMEEICGKLQGHKDILCGTNTEVFRNFGQIE